MDMVIPSWVYTHFEFMASTDAEKLVWITLLIRFFEAGIGESGWMALGDFTDEKFKTFLGVDCSAVDIRSDCDLWFWVDDKLHPAWWEDIFKQSERHKERTS